MEISVLTMDWVAGQHHPGADIVAAVLLAVEQDRQFIQVGFEVDNFLARRFGNDPWCAAVLDSIRQGGDDLCYWDAEVLGNGTPNLSCSSKVTLL